MGSNQGPAGAGEADAGKTKDHGVLYIGVDLGTSRTSISASNGVRATVASLVGYPKDHVARKLLKRDILFGEEALEKRLSLKMFRPLERGVIKGSEKGDFTSPEAKENLEAARALIRHAVSLAQPRPDELIYGVIGAPAQASIHNQKAIIEAAREVMDAVMLCSQPFSVAYGMDWLEDVLVIDIGAGTTDLCRMHGTMPEEGDQITLPTAGDYIDEQLERNLAEACPGASFSRPMVKRLKEKYSFVGEASDRIQVELPVDGKPTSFDITEAMRKSCRSIVPPMVESIHSLVRSFDPEFQDRLRNRVLLAGGGSQIQGLDRALEQEMRARLGGGRVIRTEEPMYGGANGALKIAHDMPPEHWEQLS
ncbi:MAG: rod shape-determining protein [Planctomycetes bacterium]|nr:rod shape-determining protein [Planctomycetota bacterium]